MNLRDKAAKVNFDDLDEDASPASAKPDPSPVDTPAPRPRATGVAGITDRINLHHQVQELQGKVAQLESAKLVVMLDPRTVQQSKWRNRHELSFSTQAYADLKSEIESAGGNVQPIKVRRMPAAGDAQELYEVVYGRRRLRACLELGFEVAAIIEEMDEIALFKEMERENRNRADLSPWEQGVMYKDALDAKLFASQRQMSAALNVSLSNLNTALALASLPEEVINSFASPLLLQYRWAADINAALEKDTARVLTTAQELAKRSPKLPAKEVLEQLTKADEPKISPSVRELKSGAKVLGSFNRDTKGGLQIKLKGGALSAANEKKLLEFLEKLIS